MEKNMDRLKTKEARKERRIMADSLRKIGNHEAADYHEAVLAQIQEPRDLHGITTESERAKLHDPRPADLAELARLTAIELRKYREAWHTGGAEVWTLRLRGSPLAPAVRQFAHLLNRSDFDNLGPVACASAIQALEVARAQEWAGDK
jgi:hypothetical protein